MDFIIRGSDMNILHGIPASADWNGLKLPAVAEVVALEIFHRVAPTQNCRLCRYNT